MIGAIDSVGNLAVVGLAPPGAAARRPAAPPASQPIEEVDRFEESQPDSRATLIDARVFAPRDLAPSSPPTVDDSAATSREASQDERRAVVSQVHQLTAAEQEQVEKLEARDREVRTHEQAHVAAGGSHVLGGPSYQYQTGPDGKQYAIGGEVQIDVSPVPGDPQATIAKAQTIRAAALAPASPSAQDRAIAAKASQMEQQAQAELQQLRQSAAAESTDPVDDEQATATGASTNAAGTSASEKPENAPAGLGARPRSAYESTLAFAGLGPGGELNHVV